MVDAVIFDEMGGPEVLKFMSKDAVRPDRGEAVVAMRTIGLNRSDAAFRSGKYLVQPTLPCGLGVEGAGVVTALGPDVSGLAVGDRVSILPAFAQGGRYATYMSEGVFPVESLLPVPVGLDDIGASSLWVSYLTAWGAMVELGAVGTGDHVLISAASSSVGLAAIRIANLVGAVPIATTRTRAKADALSKAGAAHILVSDEQDIPAAVLDITGAAGLRLAFDPIAGPFAESLVPCMAEEGIIFIYGGLSNQPTMFDRRPILAKGLSLTGYTVGQILKHPDRMQRGRAFVEDAVASGDIAPHVDRVFPFSEVVDAHRYMEANGHVGKIVMTLA